MKSKIIYTEDKIYVYLNSKLNKSEVKKIEAKIDFIKANYVINETIITHEKF